MNADERRYFVVKNIFKYICHGQTQNFYLKILPVNICFYRRLSAFIGGL